MHQCRKFKFWRRWLESAGQADSALVGRAPTYLIYNLLYESIYQTLFYVKSSCNVQGARLGLTPLYYYRGGQSESRTLYVCNILAL